MMVLVVVRVVVMVVMVVVVRVVVVVVMVVICPGELEDCYGFNGVNVGKDSGGWLG